MFDRIRFFAAVAAFGHLRLDPAEKAIPRLTSPKT